MKTRYLFWSLFLILSLSANGLCVRALALQSVPYYDSLSTRGFVCLIFVLIFARFRALSLKPKASGTQVFRAAIAGLALSLFTLSYNWLSASAISVLSNIDVPLLIVLGPWIGMRSSTKMRLLSLASILLLFFYVTGLEKQPHLYLGLGSLGAGCLLLCFGYYFIKRSMLEENEAVTILTPSLAILFFGIVQHVHAGAPMQTWTWLMLSEALLAGLGMFGAYFATMKLYAITDIATAEFPTLIASVLIQPMEAMCLHTPVAAPYFLSSIVFVFIICRILFLQNAMESPAHG